MERHLYAAVLAALFLSACGGGSDSPSPAPNPPPPPVEPPPAPPPPPPPPDDDPPAPTPPPDDEPPPEPAPPAPKVVAYTDLMYVDVEWAGENSVDIIYSTDRHCDWDNHTSCPGGTLVPNLPATGSLRLEAARDRLGANVPWYFVAVEDGARSSVRRARAAEADDVGQAWAVHDGTLYVGGAFRGIGPVVNDIHAIDATTGRVIDEFPEVGGTIYTVIPDGNGGWFVGGFFAAMGGEPRVGLARVRANGELDPDWAPVLNGGVRTLLLHGGVLYVGGHFDVAGGAPRLRAAAFDAETGELMSWNPIVVGNHVAAMVRTDFGILLGGSFVAVGGVGRQNLALVDFATGAPAAWTANADGAVEAIAATDGRIAAAGWFSTIGGQARNRAAVFDAQLNLLAWAPQTIPNGVLRAATFLADGSLVLGGWRNSPGGGIVKLYAPSSDTASWEPVIDGEVKTVSVHGNTLYAGGGFRSFDGESRVGAVAIDLPTLTVTSWNPSIYPTVEMLRPAGDVVIVGGAVSSANYRVRGALAAFDLESGFLLDWDPTVSSSGAPAQVTAMQVAEDRLYVTGTFDTANGEPRTGAAAFALPSGAVHPWTFEVEPGVVETMVPHGSRMYVAGGISKVNGVDRSTTAAVTLTTGALEPWDVGLDGGWATEIGVTAGKVYLHGALTQAAGESSRRIVVADAATGALQPWAEYRNSDIHFTTMLVDDAFVYVAGPFTTIDGKARAGAAALDVETGTVDDDWAPEVTGGTVRALARYADRIVLGGQFTHVDGIERFGLAMVDAHDGSLAPWSLPAGATVDPWWRITVVDDSLILFGEYADTAGRSRRGFFVIDAVSGELRW